MLVWRLPWQQAWPEAGSVIWPGHSSPGTAAGSAAGAGFGASGATSLLSTFERPSVIHLSSSLSPSGESGRSEPFGTGAGGGTALATAASAGSAMLPGLQYLNSELGL